MAKTSQDLAQWLGIPEANKEVQVDFGDLRGLIQDDEFGQLDRVFGSNPTQFLQSASSYRRDVV